MRYYGVTEFIRDICTEGPRRLESSRDLYEAYLHHAPPHLEVMSQNRVGRILRSLGFMPYRTNKTRYWRGLSL